MAPVALSVDMMLVLIVLGLAIILLVTEVVRVDVAAIIIMVTLGVLGLVPPHQIFDGFSSNAVVSIIAITIIGAGLDRTGLMSQLAGRILRLGGISEKRVIPIVLATGALISGFTQNIAAAALLTPVVSQISTRSRIPISRMLMSMGLCAILGGTLTMIGSSPLILLNDLIDTSNRMLPSTASPIDSFNLFSVTPIGIVLVVTGILYFTIAGNWVLPKEVGKNQPSRSSRDSFDTRYGVSSIVSEVKVTSGSNIVGLTTAQVESGIHEVCIIVIRNGNKVRVPPTADEAIADGSILALLGKSPEVDNFLRQYQLARNYHSHAFFETLNPTPAGLSEVIVPPSSSFIGRPIGEIGMRQRFGTSVIAVARGSETFRKQVRSIVINAGDGLVLHSRWQDLNRATPNQDLIVITDYPKETPRPKKVIHAVTFFLPAIGLVLFTDIRLSLSLFIGAIGMILCRVLTIDGAYRAIG